MIQIKLPTEPKRSPFLRDGALGGKVILVSVLSEDGGAKVECARRTGKHQNAWGQSSRHRRLNVQTSTSNARSPLHGTTDRWPRAVTLVFDSRKIKPVGRVKGWRAYIRVRWRFRRFRAGPQSGSHRPVSSPCSPNPACRFPAPGSPVGSCTSYTDRRAIRACRWSDSPTSSAAAARRPLCIPSRVRRAVEPVHASTTSNLSGSTPSLTHVMLPESLRRTRGPALSSH